MKKIFTLFSAALLSASAWANVVFTDENGSSTYTDGQTMVIRSVEDDGDFYLDAPQLKNEGATDVNVKLVYTINRLPEGTKLADCMSGACVFRSKTDTYTTDNVAVAAGAKVSTLIEWNCYNAENNVVTDFCKVSFDVYENDVKTSTIIVKYVNGDVDITEGDDDNKPEVKTILIGYDTSDFYETNGGSLYGAAGKDSVIAASILPESMFKDLSDGKISTIRFALAAEVNVTNAYIYKVSEKVISTIACTPIPGGKGKKGWNTINFPTPVDLPKNADLMLGFTYYEASSSIYPLSLNSNIVVDGGTLAYFNYQGQRGWYDLSGNGTLCIQAYVQSSMIPEFDIKMSDLLFATSAWMPNQTLRASFNAHNFGTGEISSYKFEVKLDNSPIATITEKCGVKLSAASTTIPVEFNLPATLKRGIHNLTIEATEINGKAITTGVEDDVLSADFSLFETEDVVTRQRHLIEECTSHSCTYCPYGTAVLDKMLELHPGELAVACIHGNQSSKDPYNTTEINNLLSYLGCNAFPSAALNRSYIAEERGLCAGLGYSNAAAAAPMVYDMLVDGAMPSFASVDITAVADNGKLNITISGQGGPVAQELLKDYSLTVYVLESGLINRQLKLGTWVSKFTHNHVVRKVATAITGDNINWLSASAYSNELQVTLDASWNIENMSVVAFLSKKQPANNPDYTNMGVTNANEAKITNASSIDAIVATPAIESHDKKVYSEGEFSIFHKGMKFDLLGR